MSGPATQPTIHYPDSDGKPMADNTRQFEEITMVKMGLDALFRDRDDVFVAGDLLWYPVEGDSRTRLAPDVLVAFSRPRGHRGSYRQWEEDGIAPQVVFEILSPGNTVAEMLRKFAFYDRYGVEEYYVYDPDTFEFTAAHRQEGSLAIQEATSMLHSPRLGIHFEIRQDTPWTLWRPDGERFLTYLEMVDQRDQERHRADWESQRADRERQRADAAEARAAAAEAELERLRPRPE